MVGRWAEREGIGGQNRGERGFLSVMWPQPICQSQAKLCLSQAQFWMQHKDGIPAKCWFVECDAMRVDLKRESRASWVQKRE